MNLLKLIRLDISHQGVYGALLFDNYLQCLTLERPWKLNQKNISCIPDDLYICERTQSPRFRETFEVMDVPNRTNILFHKGNTITDSSGCIILGDRVGFLNGKRAVLNSKIAFDALMNKLSGVDKFSLQIEWSCSKLIY